MQSVYARAVAGGAEGKVGRKLGLDMAPRFLWQGMNLSSAAAIDEVAARDKAANDDAVEFTPQKQQKGKVQYRPRT